MRVRILHQSLCVDGENCCEGQELETSNPHVIAYALGLKELNKPRQTNDGRRLHGDHRAAEALTEPTKEELAAAKAVVENVPTGPRPPFMGWAARPPTVELGDASVSRIAAAMMGAGVKKSAG